MEENIECSGFIFFNNFDSANLAKVEKVENNESDSGKTENNKTYKNALSNECPRNEFNLWTKHDCHGTEFQNNNRTWFYFGIKASMPGIYVKLNLVNLNKQLKMFSQGMSPVFKVIPGHPHWERIKEKPTFIGDDNSNEFVLSFSYKTSENSNAITYFAFTYPFSYTDLQNYLKKIDRKILKGIGNLADDIYYHKECAIKSLGGRKLDILTISSYYNILPEREAKIKGLYPEKREKRAFKFKDKKVIFLSARVHPGETPSSFVLNGFLNFILNREDQIAIALRRLYVFKLIPMLNPDGVSQGYYRMDTKGVNLNRLYLNPSKADHPTIYAAKTLLRYYHSGYNLSEETVPDVTSKNSIKTNDSASNNSISKEDKILKSVNSISYEEKKKSIEQRSRIQSYLPTTSEKSTQNQASKIETLENIQGTKSSITGNVKQSSNDSGIFLYIDFHGHASKKGIFMYGNHFDDPEEAAACMLLPKLMSINNANFHFTSCNFAEKNMYLVDKRDGMSREGSGRVAVYKLTGLIYSYTLECNYNTGRIVNTVPARIREGFNKFSNQLFVPPKYTPIIFEEVGAALGPSILDMTGSNPNSRLLNSHYRSLKGLQAYLKLISASNYQPSLNKPFQKNNGENQFYFSEDAASNELVNVAKYSKRVDKQSKLKNNFKFQNNSYQVLRPTNIFGTIRKIKNSKRHSEAISHNIQKNPNKNYNRDSKIIASKIISTHSQPNYNIVTLASKQTQINAKPNFSTKSKVLNKVLNVETKKSVINTPKKSTVSAKRSVIKKQGTKKLKSLALSKIRQQFQIEIGETSMNNLTTVLNASHKQKSDKNMYISNKKTRPHKIVV